MNGYDLPECCLNCKNRDDEYNEWSGESSVFCTKNVWWPTKKKTCSKQEPYLPQAPDSTESPSKAEAE